MSYLPDFIHCDSLSMGVELEMQLVDLHQFNLAMEANDFLRRLAETSHPGEIKPEITQSMIELNTSIHYSYGTLLDELRRMRDVVSDQAKKTYIGVCGGGTHPFQKWEKQRIYPNERFASLSDQYGYLAKQFTVFGQHIHIGCPSGDDALYLCHALVRYLPQFIALSAASPFSQGVDTAFDCSRLTVISAFPLSGTPPWVQTWDEFRHYYDQMHELGIIKSVKDFYWDVRPKPEYGTIEIRICDTPLTVDRAADLAAYAQALVHWLLSERPLLSRDIYLTYLTNRFRAARYGLEAIIIDPIQHTHKPLLEDVLNTADIIESHAGMLGCLEAINRIRASVLNHENDATWLRKSYEKTKSLPDTVRLQTERWLM